MRKYIVARKNIVSVVLVLAMVITSIVCVTPKTVEAASAKLYISASSKTVDAGQSTTLKVGTKKKVLAYSKKVNGVWKDYYETEIVPTSKTVKWSTSNKKIATVSSKGKVTGKKAGTCTVTAKVGSKSYKCKVTVKRPVSKDLLEIKSVATAKNCWCGAAYRIKNNNDYTVEFAFDVKYYDENGEFINTCELDKRVVGSGETIYITANGPGEYEKAKPVIKNLKKSEYKSAIKDIEVSLNEAGDCVTVTNNSDFTVTRLRIECWRINENKQIDMVILLCDDNFSENGLKPGKSYTCKVNLPDSNWERVFGDWIQISPGLPGYIQPGKPDRMVIKEASDRVVNTITVN